MDGTTTWTPFELLVSALNRRSAPPLSVILLIKQYYTRFYSLAMNMCIAYNYSSSVHEMQLFNITNEETHSYQTYSYIQNISNNDGPKCTINNTSLPIQIQDRCSKDGMNPLSPKQIRSANWCMTVQIGSNCLLNAITNRHDIYGVYKFLLPSFPSKAGRAQQVPTALTYNSNKQILYAMNTFCESEYFQTECNKIYALDFTDANYEWNLLKHPIKKRYNTTACMVDHNQHIAILGGDSFGLASKHAELYALNCGKSVTLKEMITPKDFALSIYHDTFHRIIVADTFKENKRYDAQQDNYYGVNYRQLEWYDINTDKWMLIEHDIDMERLSNICISKVNPNVIVFIGKTNCDILVYQFDMRTFQLCLVSKLEDALACNYFRHDACALYL